MWRGDIAGCIRGDEKGAGLRVSPVFPFQSGDPCVVSHVSGDQDSARFKCGGGDDEVRITTWQFAVTGASPKIFRTFKDAVGDWKDQ